MATQFTNTCQVQFLHGTEDSLQSLRKNTSNIKPGAFYVTSDTNRMYLGVKEGSANKIVPLNQGVITVAAVANLPSTGIEVGYFYYATSENVLCVYNGNKWVQINPDTNTTITSRSMTAEKKAGETALKVTDTISDSALNKYEAVWGFEEEGGNVTITVAKKTYTENGSSVVRNMFTIKCDVTIGTTESKETGIIKLVDSGDDDKTVTIQPKSADTKLTVSSTGNGIIYIDDLGLRNADIDNISYSYDEYGNGQISISSGTSVISTASIGDVKIEYGNHLEPGGSAYPIAYFNNGIATLDVYTKGDVDKLIAATNAMTFIGVLSSTSPNHSILPTTNVRVGDTYKVGENRKYYTDGTTISGSGKTYAVIGDLFIATGTESEETGFITTGLKWEYVPSGNEEGVVQTFSTQNHGFYVKEGTDTLLDFKLAVDTNNPITLTDTDSTDGKTKAVTIKHADVTLADDVPAAGVAQTKASATAPNASSYITYVKEVKTNAQGHVTQINTQTVTLADTNATLDTVQLTASSDESVTNGVVLTSTVQLDHPADSTDTSDQKSDTMIIQSTNDNLKVSVTAAGAVNFNLVWGTF